LIGEKMVVLGIDAALFLKGRYRLVGQAENSQFVARRLQRRLRRTQVVLRLDQGGLGLLIILERNGLALEQILGARVTVSARDRVPILPCSRPVMAVMKSFLRLQRCRPLQSTNSGWPCVTLSPGRTISFVTRPA